MIDQRPTIGGVPTNVATGTIWMNALGQVIRVDGRQFDDGQYYASAFHFAYDAEGRLVEARDDFGTTTYEHTPSRITEVYDLGGRQFTSIYDLTDGRITRYESPLEDPEADRHRAEYAFDAEGRIVRTAGVYIRSAAPGPRNFERTYSYDAEGRLIEQVRNRTQTVGITYSNPSPDRLQLDLAWSPGSTDRWVYTFDPDGRVTRFERSVDSIGLGAFYEYSGDTITGSYGKGETRTAVGACDAPRVQTAHDPTPQITWRAKIDLPSDVIRDAFRTFD